MIYIDFNDKVFTEILEKMLSGLLPYSDDKLDNIRESLRSDIENKFKLDLLDNQKELLNSELNNLSDIEKIKKTKLMLDKIKEKEVQIKDRLIEDDSYSTYLEPLEYNLEVTESRREDYFDKLTTRIINTMINDKLEYSDKLFEKITKYIHLDEFKMEYYVLMTLLSQVSEHNKTNRVLGIDVKVRINRRWFESLIENEVEKLVKRKRKELDLETYMEQDGLDTNFSIDINIDNAMSYLANRCFDLYDRITAYSYGIDEAISMEMEFRSALTSNLSKSTVDAQVMILGDRLYVNGRYYQGEEDWLTYINDTAKEIKDRLDSESTVEHLTFSNLAYAEEKRKQTTPKDICDFGIEPLDNVSALETRKLITIVGQEGTGKTQICCYLASRIMKAGTKVLYLSTELPEVEIMNRMISSYIMQRYNRAIPWKYLRDRSSLSEDLVKNIKLIEEEIGLDDLGYIRNNISYEEFKSRMRRYVTENNIGVIIVDHSAKLKKGSTAIKEKEYIDMLGDACVELRNELGVTIIVTSHPSPEAKNDLKKFGYIQTETTPAYGSGSLSKDADLVLIFSTTQDLKKQGLIQTQIWKSREGAVPQPMFKLRTDFSVSHLTYHNEDQGVETSSIDIDPLLGKIEREASMGI